MYYHKDPDSSPGMDSWPLHEPHGSFLYQRVSALVDSPVGSSTAPSPEASLKSKPTSSLSDTFTSMALGVGPTLKLYGAHEENPNGDQRGDTHTTTGQEAKTAPSRNKETSTEEKKKITFAERAKSPGPKATIQAPLSRSGNQCCMRHECNVSAEEYN